MDRRIFVSVVRGLAVMSYLLLLPPPTHAAPQDIYFEEGLIVHRGKDGGDTAQREGWYWTGVWIRANVLKDPWPVARTLDFREVISRLEPKKDGIFYRHPTLPPWNNPFDKKLGFSRDQMVPLVSAMGLWDDQSALRRLWNALFQDPVGGTKHTFNGEWISVPLIGKVAHTGDIVGPMTINLFRRSWKEDPMAAGDNNGPGGEGELSCNVDLRVCKASKDADDTGDDLNVIVMLLMSVLRSPSPQTACMIDKYMGRPHSYGSYLDAYRKTYGSDGLAGPPSELVRKRFEEGIRGGWKPEASPIYGAVRWYHRAETGANPALADLYAPIVAFLEGKRQAGVCVCPLPDFVKSKACETQP